MDKAVRGGAFSSERERRGAGARCSSAVSRTHRREGPVGPSRNSGMPSGRGANRAKRSAARTIAALLMFCMGFGILVYPYVAQRINNESATRLVAAYNESVQAGAGGQSDGEGSDVAAYAAPIPDEGVYGSIFIPKLSLELPIFIGSTDANLSKGIAHLEGTSLPTGGESTHSVLAGHNNVATNEWFTNIDRLVEGDLFYIRNGGTVLTYQVVSTQIIAPTDTSTLLIERGRDLVTLLTCTDSGAERLLVTGERVLDQ